MMVGMVVACEPQRNEDCEYGFKKGTVVYSGAPETDGCGWLITIDSVTYHPVNLDRDFQVADLAVLLKFTDDPEEFRCGRGGQGIPSIRITEIKADASAVGILKEDEWDRYSMDGFRLDSAYISGDNLMMQVSYSGGCEVHDFKLWKLPPNALDPPPVELALSHDANNDQCEAWITRWLAYSLVPIRERGKNEVTFLLRGSPEMSAYFGKFVYRY
jgi:hypothetical protein